MYELRVNCITFVQYRITFPNSCYISDLQISFPSLRGRFPDSWIQKRHMFHFEQLVLGHELSILRSNPISNLHLRAFSSLIRAVFVCVNSLQRLFKLGWTIIAPLQKARAIFLNTFQGSPNDRFFKHGLKMFLGAWNVLICYKRF